MDKNTIIGLVLIFGIIFGFSWLNKPSEAEMAAMQQKRDSIAMVNESHRLAEIEMQNQKRINDSIAYANRTIDTAQLANVYGSYASAIYGEQDTVLVETDLLRLKFLNKGGRVVSAELKEYRTHDSLPLVLFDGKEASQNFTFVSANNRVINTESLYFKPIVEETADAKIVTMRLEVEEGSHLDFVYTIPMNDYMTSMQIKANNMQHHIAPMLSTLEFNSSTLIRQQEKGRKFEERYANLYYKYVSDDVEKLSESSDDRESLIGGIKWVAFKDHFFSTILVSPVGFESAEVESKVMPKTSKYIKEYSLRANVDFDPTGVKPTIINTYYGPNKYQTLASYDKGVEKEDKLSLQKIVPLGWALFRWVSTLLVIPMFNFFGSFMSNYGLIILLMTLVIKLILLPFTYKSYMSTAKMRVLKPQIDEINARIPAEKATERQQATMALYSKVGVSPMSGCLPMLLQMPILFAMFAFFPSAIELRQQSFLWADDLSSYDAILSWSANIPLISSTFGNHISLFCLLMTVTNIIYTKINMAGQNNQMPGMGMVMYLMPVMFLFMFNNYAAGLSYYYFVSLLITIGQTYLFRLFVDEKKVLAKLEANKNKPKKKSGFMQRLEDAQKARLAELQKQQRRK